MIVDLNKLDLNEVKNFKNGDGSVAIGKINELDNLLNNLAKIVIHPHSSIGHHTHTQDSEIIYCLKGKGLVYDKDKYLELKEGMLNIIDEGEHELINNSDEELEILIIVIKRN